MIVVIVNLQRVPVLEVKDHAKIFINADRPAFRLAFERVDGLPTRAVATFVPAQADFSRIFNAMNRAVSANY
jgi:hypothetical protein